MMRTLTRTLTRVVAPSRRVSLAIASGMVLLSVPANAQTAAGARDTLLNAKATANCANCAEWNLPQQPFQIFGNTYYVGTRGLAAVLVTSAEGHILIDGGLPESAALIADNIARLGFKLHDVKQILNSHAHFDHAGGIAALQMRSGATVTATRESKVVLERGTSDASDPQFGALLAFPAVRQVRVISDRGTVRVGPLVLTAHVTPAHTAGGTSWSWQSCVENQCLNMVYADSQSAISADGYLFTRSPDFAARRREMERGYVAIEQLSCDVLITPHPGASALWDRLAARERGDTAALIDVGACKRYAAAARQQLARRLESEKDKK